MKALLKYLLTNVIFLFLPLTAVHADLIQVDLSINLSITQSVVESNQPYTNNITITNSSEKDVSVTNSSVEYTLPTGTSYNSSSGTGWSCSSTSTSVTCTYATALAKGSTSNLLILNINAPDNITTLNPTATVSVPGYEESAPADNTATASVDVGKANLTATKTVSKTTLAIDELFTYTITVKNLTAGTTTVPARNIHITDTIPTSLTFIDFATNELGCSNSGNSITCDEAELTVDATKTVVINVKASPGGGTDIINSATISADSSDYNTIPFTVSANAINIQQADVMISKTLINGIDSSKALVDSNVTYRLTVSNAGATDAINVVATDILPAGVTFVSATTGCVNNSNTVTCTLTSDLVNGTPKSFDIVVTMPSTHQTINNTANVSTDTAESNSNNNSDTLTTYVKGADLNIFKTPDNGSTDIGSNYTYTISIDNAGYATATNIVVTDTLDASMTYVSDTGGCSRSGQVLTCNISNLAKDGTSSFTVTVTMPTDSLNDVTNSVSIATTTDQQNNDNTSDSATTHITGPNLNITKTANVTEVGLGKPFTYTINVSNINTADAKNAKITDQLPSGVTITSITNPDNWICPATPITGTFDCTLATFAGGASSSITFNATAPTSTTGSITNRATISHDLDSDDGSDTAIVNVTGVILDINKVASATAEVGGLIDYSLTISNNSHSDAENLTIIDDLTNLGTGYTVNSISDSDGWNCGSSVGTNTLTCTRALLAAEGATSTIVFDVNVPNTATLGTVTNTASVTTTTTPAPTETASANTNIEGADIVVVPPTTLTAIANENVVFTVEVRNDGSATAKDVDLKSYFNTNAVADFSNIAVDCNNDGSYETTVAPYTCNLGDIIKNGSKTVKISATAPNYDSIFTGQNILNGSLATTSTSQSDETNDNVDWGVEIHGSDLVINKSSNIDEVAVGKTVTYTISLTNQWEANATNINITDAILQTGNDGFKLVPASLNAGAGWSCTNVTQLGFDCSYSGTLTQNQSTTNIIIDAIAPNDINAIDTSRDNRASVTTDTAERETATSNTNIATVVVRGADLSITKIVNPNPAQLNELVTYTITVTNSGLADANETYVDDILPTGHTNISTSGCTNDGSNVTGNSVHCTLGTIAQGISKQFTITTNAPNVNGVFTNTATTNSSTLEIITNNNDDSVTLNVQGADLVINKIAPARVAGNSYFTYTLNIQNIGLSTAYGATINDTLPTNVNYVGPLSNINADWSCSENASVISCNTIDSNLTIPSGYNQNIVSFLVQANPAHYWINNTATTDTNTSESTLINNTDTSTTEVIDVDLAARKLVNGVNYGANENYVAINETFTYTIQVENASLVDIDITDVNVTDIIPTNVTNISVTPDARFTCNNPTTPGATLTCTMNDGLVTPLQRSEGWITVATITVDAIDANNFDINDENNNFIINRYKATTTLSDENLENNAPTTDDGYLHTNTLVRGVNMSINKTVSTNPVGANQNFTYNLEIKNWPRDDNNPPEHDIPSTIAENIVVKDTLPTNVTYVNATGTNWSCSEASQIVTCNYTGNINAQNIGSNIIVTTTAPNSHNEILSNEANVTAVTPELVRLLPDNSDTIDTTTQGTDITITKTGPATAGMSDTVTYSVSVRNLSTITPASDIYVLDTLPNGAVYIGNISDAHWSLGADVNGSKQFIYDQNLSVGATTTFNFDVTLPHTTGIVRNHVETFTSTQEISTPNVADWDIDIQGANIKFNSIPSQNPNPVGAYGSHQYGINIKNEGLSSAKDINVTLTLNDVGSNPGWANVSGSGTNWTCGVYDTNNHKISCQLPTLANNSVSSLLTISSTAPNYNGNIINSISVVGIDDTNATTGETINITTTIRGSDLKITKFAHDPDPLSDGLYHDDNITVGTGKPIDFKIAVLNDNLGIAKEIFVTDTFPSGFTNLSITSQGDWTSCSFSESTLTCYRNELAPGVSAGDIIISATAPGIIGTFTNSTDINTTTQEFDTTNNNDSVDIKIEGATLNATLDASKTNVAMDEIFTYTLDITNIGRNDAIDVNITDILNTDFTYIDANGSDAGWSCAENNNTITCNQALIIAYNGHSALKLNVKAPANKIGTYSNDIDINSNSIENPIHISAPDVKVLGADLAIDINATPAEVLEDRNVTYVINIKNINISTAYNINVGQTFTENINALYIDDNGSATCNIVDANQSIECSFSSLEYNEDKNITIIATMPSTNSIIDPLTSTVTVSTTSPQEDTSNDASSVDVKVLPIMPVANYRFDECKWNGTTNEVIDSISGLNGTSKNGADTINHRLVEDSTDFSPIWRVGKFDGINDYVTINDNTKLQITHNQTLCAWVKPTNFFYRRNIIAKAYGGEGTITQEKDGSLSYYYGTAGGNSSPYQGFGSSQPLVLNKWSHICLIRDLDNMKLKWYINSVKTNEGNANYANATASNNKLYIGAGYVSTFKGNIDEVEIYNIALDDRAVNDIYNFERDNKNYDGTDRPQSLCGVDLQVLKTASPSSLVGAEHDITYTIKVKNLSAEPVTEGFVLRDNLPTEVELISDERSVNWSGCTGDQNITCTFPIGTILDYNQEETVTLHVKTKNLDKVNISNTATATAVQPDTNTVNNSSTANNTIIGTDLKITKTAIPESPNAGEFFIYKIKIENISALTDAKDIVMTDSYDSRLTYDSITTSSTNESNISANCSANIDNRIITCDGFNLSMGNYIEFDVTMLSQNEELGLENNSSVTSRTLDTDLSNNISNIVIDTNTSALGNNIIDLQERDFRNDSSVNKYGDIATIGNTVLTTTDSSGRLIDINSTYVQNSSARLDIIDPINNGEDNITIEYAGLFWGGHIHGTEFDDNGTDIRFEEVTFITPDGNHTIIASKEANATDRVGYYHFKKGADENNVTGNYRIFYGAKADITSIIRDLNSNGNLEGNYAVADMKISDGVDTLNAFTPSANGWQPRDYGHFGGWSMVVSYSVNHRYHREVRFKNLASFSGFRIMAPKNDGDNITVKIPIQDFITPLSGNIESSLFSFIQGGDEKVSLEHMSVEDKNNIANDVIEDTNNTNNIFNSTITLKDITGSDITKNPDVVYNVGTDIDQFNLNSEYDSDGNCINVDGRPCYLSNRQNATEVAITVQQEGTTSEQAFAQMMSMSTQIFAPDFIDSYKECFKLKEPLNPSAGWVSCDEDLPLLRRGDIMKYRITAINTGDDYAKDVYILDELPIEVNYEDNSSIVTYITEFNDPDANQTCSNPNYNYDEDIRTSCSDWLKDQVDGNITSPYVIPSNLIDNSYNGLEVSGDKKVLKFTFPTFPKNHSAWIEFNTTVNGLAGLGNTIQNKISITFTNPTLDDFGYIDSEATQVSLPVVSSPINFKWDNIHILVKDKGRDTVGAKVVNELFDLNVTLSGISDLDIDVNTTIRLNTLNIIDQYNGLTKDIYATISDANNSLGDINTIHWFTTATKYDRASKELGFDMNISVHDGNYTASRRYPQDFDASLPYAGDVFTTRPASFAIALSGGTTSGAYNILNAGESNISINVTAPDINNVASLNYNASLSQGAGLSIGLDNNFSTNLACINQNDLNITDANFIDGLTNVSNIKYNEVGVIKLLLKDSNWTARDSMVGDCNTTSTGDNNSSDANGLISCSVDGNSTSVVYKPDHFSFVGTTVTDHNNFTYMVENPIVDPMFATITTTIESRNADDNKTNFFSNTCFANDVNISVLYNSTSKDLSTVKISTANENNLSVISTDTNINTSDNLSSIAFDNNFLSGSSNITIRVAIDRNQTQPQQPVLLDPQDINGSVDNYLGITNADVSSANGTNIATTNNLHFYYGRVHAPDYRFAGDTGNAKIYYEVYCNDCNNSEYNISNNESLDSINWYINTLHSQVIDGNVSLYKSLDNVTFNATHDATSQSTNVVNGVETIQVTAPSLPYKDKVEMNSTSWTTFSPNSFLLEFQDKQKDWAGQGELGHIIDTNVSKRSNRRLEW